MKKNKKIFFINKKGEKEYVDFDITDNEVILNNKYSKEHKTLDSLIESTKDSIFSNSFEFINIVYGNYDELTNRIIVKINNKKQISSTFELMINNPEKINEYTQLEIETSTGLIAGIILTMENGEYRKITPDDVYDNRILLTYDFGQFTMRDSERIDNSYTSTPLFMMYKVDNEHVIDLPEYLLKPYNNKVRKVFYIMFNGDADNYSGKFLINDNKIGIIDNSIRLKNGCIYLAELKSVTNNYTYYFNFSEISDMLPESVNDYKEPKYLRSDIISGRNVYRQIGIVPVVSGRTLDDVFSHKIQRIINYNEIYVVKASSKDDVLDRLSYDIYHNYNKNELTDMIIINDNGYLEFKKHGITESSYYMYIDIEFVS